MVRITNGKISLQRRKKVLDLAKGFRGSLSKLYRPAMQAVTQALTNAYRGRKEKKRYFRGVWIARINAACQANNISYSKFIGNLNKANIKLNRKMLAEVATFDAKAFSAIVEASK